MLCRFVIKKRQLKYYINRSNTKAITYKNIFTLAKLDMDKL